MTKTLGAGAMGEVYEAVDEVLGREVAIKTLKTSSGMGARLLDDRFRQEARAIAQLSHPGVVQVFDIDVKAEPPYLVMERVAGPSLDDRLEAGPLTVEEVIPLGIQIARALAAAHAAGIVHRDVKPANILYAGNGLWKLADFGVAHVPDSSLTITGQFVGSPAYASPEALVKGVAAPTGDVFALGATLYEALAGRWPRGDVKGALLAIVPPLKSVVPSTPDKLAKAIDLAVSFEAEHRPTAEQFASLLAHATIDSDAPHPSHSLPAHRTWQVPKHWKAWLVGVLVLLVLAVAIGSRSGSSRSIGEINATPPAELGRKASRDWDRIIESLREGRYDVARRRLDDFERKHGWYPEVTQLRDQLQGM